MGERDESVERGRFMPPSGTFPPDERRRAGELEDDDLAGVDGGQAQEAQPLGPLGVGSEGRVDGTAYPDTK